MSNKDTNYINNGTTNNTLFELTDRQSNTLTTSYSITILNYTSTDNKLHNREQQWLIKLL